jgi:hypothetical protein
VFVFPSSVLRTWVSRRAVVATYSIDVTFPVLAYEQTRDEISLGSGLTDGVFEVNP